MLSRITVAWWGPLLVILPLVILTLGVVVVAMVAAAAKDPSRRRHLLRLLDQLTGYATALRGQR
jgi:hypothetical protein